ncbi:integral membrane protein [Chrysochromulina tobinii]|uniref:Integral membrane protein n=1 Tax=Chrysochromulina tobinii TaxID=1460289 RepID=A0A0M0K4L2_9EUKA|nr:integral membrane protein [Chrysochromulina tobinii]|eukprot:KOO33749.1 integral membrane protein [Chrysochromulina sp. CCMP291]
MIVEMHVLGFVAKRLELLGHSAEEGLAAFVYTIGLPSLLFSQIATELSFDDINVILVVSILVAKLMVAALGVTLAHLVTREADGTGFAATLGGIVALLSTMSDDMATGMPIFAAFFSSRPMWVTLHLIVLSALQSMIVNPLVFVLLGVGRAKADLLLEAERALVDAREGNSSSSGVGGAISGGFAPLRPRHRRTASRGTLPQDVEDLLRGREPHAIPRQASPLMSAVAVHGVYSGASYNLISDGAPLPNAVEQLAAKLGESFLPMVLFVAGMCLSSSIGNLTSLRLAVLPTLLVVLKSVVLPIVCSLVYDGLAGVDVDSHQLRGLSHVGSYQPAERDFVFFYGLLPVSTASIAIVGSYQCTTLLLGREIGSAVVDPSITRWTLLTYMFIFFEDGQGFITFLLFALEPPSPTPAPPRKTTFATASTGPPVPCTDPSLTRSPVTLRTPPIHRVGPSELF